LTLSAPLSINPEQKAFINGSDISVLSKRWDGSPAMGQGYAKAKNKGCTLWATMHSDDSKAGQPFTPSQTSAHSDYVQLYGTVCTPASNND
jgi:hypothetical protein